VQYCIESTFIMVIQMLNAVLAYISQLSYGNECIVLVLVEW